MDHDGHRKLQQEILDQALAFMKGDPYVLGVMLSGSYARRAQDAFSDLDVGCYLRDEERTGRQALFNRIASLAPTLWHLWIYDLHALYLYENGVRLDVDYCKPSQLASPSEVYTDAVIVYDPNGTLGRQLQISHDPRPAEHPKWFEPGDPAMIDWFFWMFRQVVCWAKRGAQGDYRSFDKLTSAIQSLADVRTRLAEMRLWTLGYKDYLLRADPACARRLAQTYPHCEAGEIIQCARRLLAEYELVCPPYCQKSGAAYPARKVEIMYRLIDEFEQLRI
jgi:predicted nucleotidyltransferase